MKKVTDEQAKKVLDMYNKLTDEQKERLIKSLQYVIRQNNKKEKEA